MVISRFDGNILVFKEFIEVVRISSILDNLELISRAKKMPKKASKSPPKVPLHNEKKAAVETGASAILNENATQDDETDDFNDASKTLLPKGQMKLFQLHADLTVRPSSSAPIQCCSISDAGM
jgi:hypothetical protein